MADLIPFLSRCVLLLIGVGVVSDRAQVQSEEFGGPPVSGVMESHRDGNPNPSQIGQTLIGETTLASNVLALRRRVGQQPVDRQFESLCRWVLPNEDHASFRVSGLFVPTDAAPSVLQDTAFLSRAELRRLRDRSIAKSWSRPPLISYKSQPTKGSFWNCAVALRMPHPAWNGSSPSLRPRCSRWSTCSSANRKRQRHGSPYSNNPCRRSMPRMKWNCGPRHWSHTAASMTTPMPPAEMIWWHRCAHYTSNLGNRRRRPRGRVRSWA